MPVRTMKYWNVIFLMLLLSLLSILAFVKPYQMTSFQIHDIFSNSLQLCFMHPSKYKFEHPRFCLERLEYVGQKIQVDFTNMLMQLSIIYCVCYPIMFENRANCFA